MLTQVICCYEPRAVATADLSLHVLVAMGTSALHLHLNQVLVCHWNWLMLQQFETLSVQILCFMLVLYDLMVFPCLTIRNKPFFGHLSLWLIFCPSGCNGTWDKIACWPSANIGEVVTIPCPIYLLYFSRDVSRRKNQLYKIVCVGVYTWKKEKASKWRLFSFVWWCHHSHKFVGPFGRKGKVDVAVKSGVSGIETWISTTLTPYWGILK